MVRRWAAVLIVTLTSVVPLHARALLTGVPVDPDAETARRWAEEELLDPIYHQRPSLLERLLEWVTQQLNDLEIAVRDVDPRMAALIVASVVVVGVAVALVVAGPVRSSRRAARASTDVFGDDTRSAAELRASADALARDGQWSLAVLDRFRAILRSLEDRALLDPRPGRTAHEAAEDASLRLPTCAADLRTAGRLFDDVCYGDAEATPEQDAWLRELDERVAATRPAAVASAAATDRLEVPR